MKPGKTKTTAALRKLAGKLGGVTEGVACAGTTLESLTFNVSGKAFLFVSVKGDRYEVRLKLDASAKKAAALSKNDPAISIGSGNWAKVSFADGEIPAVLESWIAESHAAVGAVASAKPKPKAKK